VSADVDGFCCDEAGKMSSEGSQTVLLARKFTKTRSPARKVLIT